MKTASESLGFNRSVVKHILIILLTGITAQSSHAQPNLTVVEQWDRFFEIVRDNDPYGYLKSIHNGGVNKNYDHTKPYLAIRLRSVKEEIYQAASDEPSPSRQTKSG